MNGEADEFLVGVLFLSLVLVGLLAAFCGCGVPRAADPTPAASHAPQTPLRQRAARPEPLPGGVPPGPRDAVRPRPVAPLPWPYPVRIPGGVPGKPGFRP